MIYVCIEIVPFLRLHLYYLETMIFIVANVVSISLRRKRHFKMEHMLNGQSCQVMLSYLDTILTQSEQKVSNLIIGAEILSQNLLELSWQFS